MLVLNRLLFELKRGWVAYLVLTFLLGLAVYATVRPEEHGPKEKARIIYVGQGGGSRYHTRIEWYVLAKDSDGLTGGASFFSPSGIRGCKVGDEIEVERTGIGLKLNSNPCS